MPLPQDFGRLAREMPMSAVVERVARAIFRVGKETWPPEELWDSENRNWHECAAQAQAAISALSD